MRQAINALLIGILFLAVAPAHADDRRFAIRFGAIGLEPTSDSVVQGVRKEVSSAFGAGFVFEWYFLNRLSLEGGVLTAVDADIEDNNTSVAGVTMTPLTVGLNVHVVRNDRIDWSIGVLAGQAFFTDFEFDDTTNTANVATDDDTTYGAQTSLDIFFGDAGWGLNLGLKYLESSLDTTIAGTPETINIDPIIYRAHAVFSF